ncbi:uncharacterized protein NECHADRAFT_81502 [Fusarium vanettenii 77-13-4]|uniref:Uncharacterized protein n=1 Tax=Fusarium vanettenii (strain ATCC MYA-4622 / CBS 123669 / FGSC 9596 / NRRL 45880 / 77-13-4) TaxID=660122 RepID=C7Z8K6_FUSV7|nr:uncharacterized protein NECHADRAFT_81502 [Fusarium vanettenii 77-13-4]EEU38970.1 hypothetical protein NECHADRAFT_81502 [Fusarium vanettenii 77-13-4]
MASNPTGPGATPPGALPAASTVPNTTWNSNAHLPSPAAVNARNPNTPSKAIGNAWDHVLYVPPWMDPDWQDEGRQRDQTDFNITDFFDRIRPAVHPKDQYKKPTEYAQRFSIFPGRFDGRSRASPTRANSRKLIHTTADIKTGKDLFDSLDYSAAQDGKTIDEYMASARPDMQHGTETEQLCMQQYEDLVRAEDYFTMQDVSFEGLSGPIHPLFDRHMWADTTEFGKEPETPRYVYNLNGVREEWDPRTNDRLWNAMQPALQLATRMLLTNHPCIVGMQDVTNRYRVPDHLYKNRKGQDPDEVKYKIKSDQQPLDPEHVRGAQQLQSCPGFSAPAASQRTLERVMDLKLQSAFYSSGGKYKDHCIARTFMNGVSHREGTIKVTIDAELLWIVMSDKYSKSEKMVASLVFAAALVHEMMHAFVSVAAKWVLNPQEFGITDPAEVQACGDLWDELCPDDKWPDEPYYNDDPWNEAGHAFEQHSSAPMIAKCMFPAGAYNSPPHLTAPHMRMEQLSHFTRIDDVRPFFHQGFWDVSVKKYGTAALREPSDRLHKINYNPASVSMTRSMWKMANLGTREDRDWVLYDFLNWLHEKGKSVLFAYFTALVQDAIEFGSLLWRLQQESQGWSERDAKWAGLHGEAMMLIYEYAGYTIMANAGRNATSNLPADKIAELKDLYDEWDKVRRRIGRCPDDESTICAGMGPEFWRIQMLATSRDRYEARLVSKLIDLTRDLMDECAWLENVVCEFYQLPLSYWTAYRQKFPNQAGQIATRAKRIGSALADLLTVMGLAEFDMPSWNRDWDGRILSLGARFVTVAGLMVLNPLKYEKNWRGLLPSMPNLRKTSQKRHQVWYFLAKKEMLSMEGEVLDKVREFKNRYQNLLHLGGSKVILPEYDPDEIALAQRWAGTLDDEDGNTGQGNPLARPSTGVFDTQGVHDLVRRLQEQAQQAEDDKLKRAAASGQPPTLQQNAASQATQAPIISPKIQHMGMGIQTAPFGNLQPPPNSAFAPYHSSSAGSAFPSHTPGAPSAWAAGNSTTLAQQVNKPLGAPRTLGGVRKTSIAGYGILPHPYAVRETVTSDLTNTAQTTLLNNDPSTFAQHAPRQGDAPRQGRQGAGPLGDMDQMWEQQKVVPNTGNQDEDGDVEMADANLAGAFVIEVSSDDLSSSAGDDDDRSEREDSESTSVESWSEDEFKPGAKSRARQGLKPRLGFKRKAPWMVPNPRQAWLTQGGSQRKRRRL